jgi:hypothetical protein
VGTGYIFSRDLVLRNYRTPVILSNNQTLDSYYDLIESVGYVEDESLEGRYKIIARLEYDRIFEELIVNLENPILKI